MQKTVIPLVVSVHVTGVADTAEAASAGRLAALVEPFSFQLLRHLGAALGWVVFLTGRRGWGTRKRLGLVTPRADAPETLPG